MMLDAKQKETVEQIVKMLDGYRAEEIQKILYWVNTCCDSGYVLRAEPKQCKNVFVSANNPALSVVNIIEYAVKARRLHNVGVFQAIRA